MFIKYARIQLSEEDKLLIASFNLNISFDDVTDLQDIYYPLDNVNIKWVIHIDVDMATEIQKKLQRGSTLWNKIQQAGRNVFNW